MEDQLFGRLRFMDTTIDGEVLRDSQGYFDFAVVLQSSSNFIHYASSFSWSFRRTFSVQIRQVPRRQNRTWFDAGYHHIIWVAELIHKCDEGTGFVHLNWEYVALFALTARQTRQAGKIGMGAKETLANDIALDYVLGDGDLPLVRFVPYLTYGQAINRPDFVGGSY
jgi:hypothetical protein